MVAQLSSSKKTKFLGGKASKFGPHPPKNLKTVCDTLQDYGSGAGSGTGSGAGGSFSSGVPTVAGPNPTA